jgi:hypothetical protein
MNCYHYTELPMFSLQKRKFAQLFSCRASSLTCPQDFSLWGIITGSIAKLLAGGG